MGVAKGILTTLGGMMSHAAVVARAWGMPAVCGVVDVELDGAYLRCGDKVYREGDMLSIDGDTGAVYAGAIASQRRCRSLSRNLARMGLVGPASLRSA